MANNKKELNKIAQDIDTGLNNMYIDTYKTNPTNALDLEGIKNRAYDSLKRVTQTNFDTVGNGAFSQIISRMNASNRHSSGNSNSLKNLLSEYNPDATNMGESLFSLSEANSIREYDEEIDTICEYMPILKSAIDTKKDNILSADQFSKDFLLIPNTNNISGFDDRIKAIKEKYNLLDTTEEIFDSMSLYGEAFMYVAPYSSEIKSILKKKKSRMKVASPKAILESYNNAKKNLDIITESVAINKNTSFNITVNYTGLVESFIEEFELSNESKLSNARFETFINEGKVINNKKSNEPTIDDIPGAIVRKIDRARILPLYINDKTCFGYYYFEKDITNMTTNVGPNNLFGLPGSGSGLNKNLANSTSSGTFGEYGNSSKSLSKDDVLKNMADSIATKITPKFILDNQDLKMEVYNILKYTCDNDADGVRVTYIPPENIEHFYWSKDKNHRGVSDLSRSLIPAKLYIGLYTCNTIGIMTRGFDKRVYYVKNSIDTNLTQNLLSTINTIKAGNMGMRDFSSVKNIIQSSGRFNDLLIPTSKTGEAPIDFSIMEGQNIDTKEGLLELLEHMAVGPTGVPYEYLVSRNTVDYAIRLTMSNGKFLKDCYKSQGILERPLTRFINKIYNYEYVNSDVIEVKLPPPAYLSVLNANQMIDNVKGMIDNIVDIINTKDYSEEELKTLKLKLSKHYLSGYIDFNLIEGLHKAAKVETAPGMSNDTGGGEEDSGMDDM